MTVVLRVGGFESQLRFRFSHASATRAATANVIVELRDGDGYRGYGEGCPRHYVTGETEAGARAFVQAHGPDFLEACATVEDIHAWSAAREALIDDNPAAFAALESALLDLMGRRRGIPVEALIGLPPLGGPVAYSAIIGDSSPFKTWAAGMAYSLWGFSDFKVKLSADAKRDAAKLARLPPAARLRVDANNLWHDAEDCVRHMRALGRAVWAIEEPVAPGDIASLRTIAAQLPVKIILDESLRNRSHLGPFLDAPESWVANIRVSKCGGILRSIALAREAQDAGMGVVLGAHVGETSLLTRAALAGGQGLNLRARRARGRLRQASARKGHFDALATLFARRAARCNAIRTCGRAWVGPCGRAGAG